MGEGGIGQDGMGESGMGTMGENTQPGMGEQSETGNTQSENGMGESQTGMREGQTGMGEGQTGMGEGQTGMGESGMNEGGEGPSGMGESGMGEGQPGMGEGQGGEGQSQQSTEGGSSAPSNAGSGPAGSLHTGGAQNLPEQGAVIDNPGQADAANAENLRQAQALTLQRLQERLERGELTQEQLDALGADEATLRQWARDLEEQLANIAETEEDQQRLDQLDEVLEGIQIDPEGGVREGDDGPVDDAGGFDAQRLPTPSEYRADEEAYRQRLLRQQRQQQQQ
jgi:hypothetical protein